MLNYGSKRDTLTYRHVCAPIIADPNLNHLPQTGINRRNPGRLDFKPVEVGMLELLTDFPCFICYDFVQILLNFCIESVEGEQQRAVEFSQLKDQLVKEAR